MEPDSTSTRDTPASPTPPPFSPVSISVWEDDILGDPLSHESEFAELIRLAGVGDVETVQNEQQMDDELLSLENNPSPFNITEAQINEFLQIDEPAQGSSAHHAPPDAGQSRMSAPGPSRSNPVGGGEVDSDLDILMEILDAPATDESTAMSGGGRRQRRVRTRPRETPRNGLTQHSDSDSLPRLPRNRSTSAIPVVSLESDDSYMEEEGGPGSHQHPEGEESEDGERQGEPGRRREKFSSDRFEERSHGPLRTSVLSGRVRRRRTRFRANRRFKRAERAAAKKVVAAGIPPPPTAGTPSCATCPQCGTQVKLVLVTED